MAAFLELGYGTFNRTSMELKPHKSLWCVAKHHAFNRTSMELKHDTR